MGDDQEKVDLLAVVVRDATDRQQRDRAFSDLVATLGALPKLWSFRCAQKTGISQDDCYAILLDSLWAACKAYDGERRFLPLLRVVFGRTAATEYKTQHQKRHTPEYGVLELDAPVDSSIPDGITHASYLPDRPHQIRLDEREQIHKIYKPFRASLSPCERVVLLDYLCGYSYELIAQRRNLTLKQVDNSLSRIKRKAQEQEAEMTIT